MNFHTSNKPSVILVLNGKIKLHWNSGSYEESEIFEQGESVFVPASMQLYALNSITDNVYYVVEVP